ncbi:MAG: 1-(5-phosphoribosyl)-5-[(5-phosphoribosylamino)methylideneamino]imidazole-4-carboxamide isomerase [Acutalibacteraceae bacterium]|nr:1-(5-phosphoribosyl)-5-[(5-phosphoribosylamino)methylideneamino]imidazole-4-carboxamide isomerase [Acutalibacteraceae bacterium]
MIIFPAIDLYEGKAVRLYKGDYNNMTVYSNCPEEVAKAFRKSGADHLHLVDLEGAREGSTPNIETIKKIRKATDAFIEIGGGIRSIDTVKTYIDAGVNRVILGTAAVKDRAFLIKALENYGDKIAVGVDIKDGMVAIKGWTEKSQFDGMEFCSEMQSIGVKTIICTDISRDGAMRGTNLQLYKALKEKLSLNIIASGGVTDMSDIENLSQIGVYGAIIGKAYYIGAIDISEAVEKTK